MQRDPKQLEQQVFDVLVIGAGVQGAAVAREATLRGLSVAVIDRGDFGGATSANSQKIIHGGLRYLQKLDIARLRMSAAEQQILMRLAPHLVRPLPFVIPTRGVGKRSCLALRAALALYRTLTGSGKGSLLSWPEVLERFPGLRNPCRYTGGALWYDAQATSTERLTWAFLRSAIERGATACNYVEAQRLMAQDGRGDRVLARDRLDDGELEIRARVVVNAAGPWWHETATATDRVQPPDERLVRAWNIVTRQLFPHAALGIDTLDRSAGEQRMVFLTPWCDATIIGTWYAPTDDSSANTVNGAEVDELLGRVNRALSDANLTLADVTLVHHGLLPAGSGRQRALPAEQAYIVDHEQRDGVVGFWSLRSVKYTTARRLAAEVIGEAARREHWPAPVVASHEDPLDGGDMHSPEAVAAELRDSAPAALTAGIDEWVSAYGTRALELLRLIADRSDDADRLTDGVSTRSAEVRYAVRDEMAVRLADVVFRRTALGSVRHPGRAALEACAAIMAEELNWSSERVADEIAATEQELRRVTGVEAPSDESAKAFAAA